MVDTDYICVGWLNRGKRKGKRKVCWRGRDRSRGGTGEGSQNSGPEGAGQMVHVAICSEAQKRGYLLVKSGFNFFVNFISEKMTMVTFCHLSNVLCFLNTSSNGSRTWIEFPSALNVHFFLHLSDFEHFHFICEHPQTSYQLESKNKQTKPWLPSTN